MTFGHLALASLRYYRRTHVAVVLGVASAVAVLAGSLIVGASVTHSLRSIAESRLGRTNLVVAAEQPFTEGLAKRLSGNERLDAVGMLALNGVARHEASGRRANDIRIYGVDDLFFKFHGKSVDTPSGSTALVSPDLAAELGASRDDAIVLRVAKPTDIPLDSLHGRRDETGRSIRVTSQGVLSRDQMGSFSLVSSQGPVRSVFVALSRLQKDLALPSRVNTMLIGTRDGEPAPTTERVNAALVTTATNADLGLTMATLPEADAVVVESAAGLISDVLATRVTDAAAREHRGVAPVLTWLANRLTAGDRMIPYSLITALGSDAAGDAALARMLADATGDAPPIVLNEWAAKDLGIQYGGTKVPPHVELEYYRWADEGRLVIDHARFRVAGILPMSGLAIDRRLAPDYPGITSARDFSEWDPPFPIDLKLVRKQDEDYWHQYRTAPKAFIPLAAGQALWRTRHGQLTSLRITGTSPVTLNPLPVGDAFRVADVRAQSAAASQGATDFGAYFSYFSFFLMVSALLLAALFFRLSIEQRLPQIGVLRAAGFSLAAIRRAFLTEGAVIIVIGAVAGTALAIAWARLMVWALTTWWIGAVGTTDLAIHLDPLALVTGAAIAALAALMSILLTVRALSRSSPREQIAGALPASTRRRRGQTLAVLSIGVAIGLSIATMVGAVPASAGFFGAGSLLLVGGLAAFRAWLGRGHAASRAIDSVAQLGLRNAAWRPGRSLTAAGLVAAAVFLLVSVDSFRKTAGASGATSMTGGTGGFALIGESQLPIVEDPRTLEGVQSPGVTIYPLRLRPGEDTSCLNLYRPTQPRVIGVPDDLIKADRFQFAKNSWALLLGAPESPAEVPAVVDQTSLQYVLHASVGDVITIDTDTSRPIQLRIVASLDDSIFQSEILIAERDFRRLFPDVAGYRTFLVDVADPSRAAAVSEQLEQALEPFGFDAQSTTARLEAFHRVENTYLSTFQALGGLGLLLGCAGLIAVVARNVLERRKELALLGAAGFTGRDLQRVVAIEHAGLVLIGLLIGVGAAVVAIAPVILTRSGTAPWHALIWIVPVTIAGVGAAYASTRRLRNLKLIESLRSE